MNQERDKFIVEWFGECWHNWEIDFGKVECSKCHEMKHISNAMRETQNRNLSTWEGFGWLWLKMRTTLSAASILWREFLIYLDEQEEMSVEFQVINLIDNPTTFADAVYKFLKERKEGV